VKLFEFIARNGRMALVVGLLAGILLPDLALFLRPTIAPMIVALLFIAILRLGPDGIRNGMSGMHRAVGLALLLQMVLPLSVAAIFAVLGVLSYPLATFTVLALAAAPITGSPNITLMAGGDPAPALRQLVVGTALLPLTVLPVFLVMPAFGSPLAVGRAAVELLVLIALAGGVAILLRRYDIVKGNGRSLAVMDGTAALLLGLVVIGLMSAVGPALVGNTPAFLIALVAVFAINMPIQLAAALLAARTAPANAPAIGIVAGNRNIALFLSVLPQAVADELLLFIGCFQIPMYLTPFVLAGWYRRVSARGATTTS
jgi:ACR3 family arsenite transporter